MPGIEKVLNIFILYIYDIQFTEEKKVYKRQLPWKHMYLAENRKIKKRIKNAINGIKNIKKLKAMYLNI